jgi:GNAT superfamily N-acetyltransferase
VTVSIRRATLDDLAGIAAVAVATDQAGEGAGADPRYAAHLLTRGRLVVAIDHSVVVGYAATVRVEDVDLLSDLFVLPTRHREGIGGALLDQAWTSATDRMTFSSAHPSALPLYLKFGLVPRWPVRYLKGDPRVLPRSSFSTVDVTQAEAVDVERQLGGGDRAADYGYWAARPDARLVVVREGQRTVAVGATGGEGRARGISHLRVAKPDLAGEALLAALGTLAAEAVVAVPGLILAAEVLVSCGWRVIDTDQFAATNDELVDPRLLFPHSGLL